MHINSRCLALPICVVFRSKWSNLGTRQFSAKPSSQDETYRQLENLNMMTAAKILFSDSPKKKKFGLDFHLVQLFFACMPSLAVYLVAQYARHEIRRMEAESEIRKQAEEADKAKEKEKKEMDRMILGADGQAHSELLEVKQRVEALEASIKEITVETKKMIAYQKKCQEQSNKKEVAHSVDPNAPGGSGQNRVF